MAVDPYGPGFASMYGLECLEYFYPTGDGNSPHRFVSFANGKLVAMGRTGCGSELNGMNFVPGGKYYYLRSKYFILSPDSSGLVFVRVFKQHLFEGVDDAQPLALLT
jgi:hypothetical protein